MKNKSLFILLLLFSISNMQSIPYFDAEKAFSYLEKQCDFGPRYPGSKGHLEFKNYLNDFLTNKGDTLIAYEHIVKHPYEDYDIPLYNFLIRFNLKSSNRILFLAHWDTREIADQDKDEKNHDLPILGANDGASGIALLMILTEILEKNPLNNIGVDILFVDGEDLGRFGEIENYCLGTSKFCEKLPNPIPNYAICLDMIADHDPQFLIEPYSWEQAPFLVQSIWSLANDLGYTEFRAEFYKTYIYDDHRRLYLDSYIPAIDIIDFDYPHWHTLQDTPENCSPKGLKIVGNVISEFIYRLDYE
ncbi:MAG: hypothetical protein CMG64_03225 [Candidatus Marinimicrobia bacterium]|nr:hypothetical protein [Candidatus Neomarinimicrobiota bacterium]